MPVVLAVGIAAWTVVGAAKSYVSTASLWVDDGGPGGSTLGNVSSASTPPSQAEQSVLQELLATQDFVSAVGSTSSLQQYLAAHPTVGFGPSALLSITLGRSHSLANRVDTAIAQGVSSTAPGPQVLDLSFSGPSPAVSQSTLTALITQLGIWTARYSKFYGQNQVGYDQAQLIAAQQTLKAAQTQAQTYATDHPHASPASDSVYSSLVGAVSVAATALAQTQSGLAAARSASQGSAPGLIIRAIDTPSLPTTATQGKKAEGEGILGGLIAGLLISLFAIALLTYPPKLNPQPATLNGDTPDEQREEAAVRRAAQPKPAASANIVSDTTSVGRPQPAPAGGGDARPAAAADPEKRRKSRASSSRQAK